MHLACVAEDDTLHQPEHNFVRVIPYINSPLFTNGMPSMQIGFVQALLSKGKSRVSKTCLAGFVTFSTGFETASAAAPGDGAFMVEQSGTWDEPACLDEAQRSSPSGVSKRRQVYRD